MSQSAQVASVEAIENFRARLVIYLSQMRPLVDEISREAAQVRFWLQSDRQPHWQQQLRLRHRKLEEARQELFSARLSKLQEASTLHYMAVTRAKEAVLEAENKLAHIRQWNLEIEDRAAPLTRQIEQLQGFLAADMAQAVIWLNQILATLDAYREVKKDRENLAQGSAQEAAQEVAQGLPDPAGQEEKP